eukprot:GHVU01195634.1.p1 GENE.GHVU01195634.1~~GHVU01195634.1.p1  ORF type:complete len:159 (-),score=39.94 GHVU01195634.1:1313-1789(-)
MNEESFKSFYEAALQAFKNWTALSLAVENGWGGRHSQKKREDFFEAVIDQFRTRGSGVKADDLAEDLEEQMAGRFSVNLEDDSQDEVAQLLVELYSDCMAGRTDKAKTVFSHSSTGAQLSVELTPGGAGIDFDMDDEDDDDDDDESGEDTDYESAKED